MRKYIFMVSLLALGFVAVPALAQNADVAVDVGSGEVTVVVEPVLTSESVVATSGTVVSNAVVEPELVGVTIAEPTAVPSAFGLWWRNLRENISVALTLDPVKKAEKLLVFAEERTKLAEYIMANATDDKVKAKAEDMLVKAQEKMDKVAELKDKLVVDTSERATRLKENLVKHQLRSEQALKRLEEKVSAESQEKFQELKEKSLEGSSRLLNALDNPNLPQEVKEFLQAVKNRIEETASTTKQFREEKKNLLEQAKAGDEAAREELKNLQEERKAAMENIRESFKEEREELKQEVENGTVATSTARRVLEVEKKAIEKLKEVQEKAEDQKKKNRQLRPEIAEPEELPDLQQ